MNVTSNHTHEVAPAPIVRRWVDAVALTTIVSAASALRCWRLDDRALWFDEAFSWRLTRFSLAPSFRTAPGGATLPAAGSTQLIIEKPLWSEASGELAWKGEVVLRLANNAHSERAILREFQRRGWIWLVRDPIESATIGDATQERRHATHALKKR